MSLAAALAAVCANDDALIVRGVADGLAEDLEAEVWRTCAEVEPGAALDVLDALLARLLRRRMVWVGAVSTAEALAGVQTEIDILRAAP